MTMHADGWLSAHGVHTLTLLGPAVLIGILAVGADARAWLRRRDRQLPTLPISLAAAFSVGAAAVHAVVCPEHFHEGLVYGEFFAVSAGAQLAWAGLVIFRPRRWLLVAGLAGNLAIVALWAVTRTVGIPLGPEAGEIEAVGVLDAVAGILEVAIVMCCAVAMSSRPLTGGVSWSSAAERVTASETAPGAGPRSERMGS
jgi:hypothetical protein